MADNEYYEILGVGRDAELSEIKKAYRRAAVKFHPDKNPGDKAAEDQFKRASEAYAVLSNDEKRQLYDRFGKRGVGVSGGGMDREIFADFNDVLGDLFGFGSIFGGSGARGRGRGTAGRDLRYDLEIDFEEAVRGMETQIKVPRLEPCKTCDGQGAAPADLETCSQCGGRGQVAFQQGFFTIARSCGQCAGRGKRIVRPCGECKGQGRVRRESSLKVRLPGGVDDGVQLRMAGHGEAGTGGGPAGDLYVVVRVREHPFFQRVERDLVCQMSLSFAQAALGAELKIATLDGEESIRVPPGTQSGTEHVIRGKGAPGLDGRGRGDIRVQLQVRTPTRLSDEQRGLLQQLAELDGGETDEPGLFDRVKNIFS